MDAGSSILRNEILVEAAGSEVFRVEAFARVFARRLEEAEQVFDLNVESLRCVGPRGLRLELLGFAEDLTEQSLILLAGRYFGGDETLTMTQAKDISKRATEFIEVAASGWLQSNLEVSSRECEYAEYFARQISFGRIARIRVIVITDGVMSGRIRRIESNIVAGLKASYEVWDQKRIVDVASPDRSSEDISVDFTKWLPDGLPCLLAGAHDEATETYLAVIPGKVLAAVFEEYGSLLLESNVRTFLSARGAVNRGIQTTLAQEPSRFLAYNNGLTTTATKVVAKRGSEGTLIQRIERWQIVNGGQTTASIAHFLRGSKGRSIEDVSVQMKLVTVSEASSAAIVQSVAKYANSQNRVSGADLFATHEFHIRLEQISRRVRAPLKEGQQYQTGWYYERARGQWENDRVARGSVSEQKMFELEFPRAQRITKTDWAKYAYCWGKRPHLVSKGAQSVFASYALQIDELWQKDSNKFGDSYFCSNIGKALMYHKLRSAVLKQEWYTSSPGFLANILAYAISRFAHGIEVQFGGASYNWNRVWQRQDISDVSISALVGVAHRAQLHLTDRNRPQGNVTQWAKQQVAWELFQGAPLKLPDSVAGDLITAEASRSRASDDRRQRVLDSGFEAVQRVLNVEPKVWSIIIGGGSQIAISPTENDLIRLFGSRPGRVPSEKQAAVLIRVLERMVALGLIPKGSF